MPGRFTSIKSGQGSSSEDGFSLIEMLVSMSILTVIMAAIFSFLWGASRYWQTGQDVADVTENARLGLNRMTREIKQSSRVTDALEEQVEFAVDFGEGEEIITYGFMEGSGGEPGYVWRTSDSGLQLTLMDNVDAVKFVYYGNDYRCDTGTVDGVVTYGELQACSANPEMKISRVDINLTMRSGSDSQRSFVGQAWLRNRDVAGG